MRICHSVSCLHSIIYLLQLAYRSKPLKSGSLFLNFFGRLKEPVLSYEKLENVGVFSKLVAHKLKNRKTVTNAKNWIGNILCFLEILCCQS